ncbi:MAG: O-antigen ligase family protein [Alphaproteobacteria bacterium]|nr:O-antigen ligase family protein [Alphaproteobacteria bacterium]
MRKLIIQMLCLFSFLVPLEYIFVVFFGNETPLKPYRLVAILITVSLLIYLMINRKRLSVDRVDKLYFLIFGYGFFLAAIRYAFFDLGIIEYTTNDSYLLLLCICASLVIKNINLTASEIDRILLFFVCAVLLNVILIFWEVAQGGIVFKRATGFFKNPNQAALAIVLGFWYLLIKFPNKIGPRVLSLFVLIAFVLAIVFTGSRSALLVLTLSLLCWYVATTNRSMGKIFVIVGIFFSVYLAAAIIFSTVENLGTMEKAMETRFDPDNASLASGSGRTDIWKSGFLLSIDNAFIGVGASQYKAYHQDYIARGDAYKTVLEHNLSLHNDYMVMFVEFGLVSFLIYLYILYYLFSGLWSSTRSKKYRQLATFFCMALLTIILTGVFQEQFKLMTYWLFIALALAFVKFIRKEESNFNSS